MYKYATTCVVGSWVLSKYDQPHPLLLIRLPWGGKMSQTYRRSLQSDRSDRVATSCRDRLLQPWFANGLFMTDAKSGCRVPVTLLHSPKQPRSDIGVKDQLVQSFWANTKSRVHKGWSNSKVWYEGWIIVESSWILVVEGGAIVNFQSGDDLQKTKDWTIWLIESRRSSDEVSKSRRFAMFSCFVLKETLRNLPWHMFYLIIPSRLKPLRPVWGGRYAGGT